MNITIIAVGKVKESFYRDAIKEYEKRLQKYCRLSILEVSDDQTDEKMSEQEENLVKLKEAERILKFIPRDAYVLTLEILGKKMDSFQFSKKIENMGISGKSKLVFVIGGSLGLHASVSKRADEKISFSDMTFPHQLMRVILTEQIYRSFRIIHGEPYHK